MNTKLLSGVAVLITLAGCNGGGTSGDGPRYGGGGVDLRGAADLASLVDLAAAPDFVMAGGDDGGGTTSGTFSCDVSVMSFRSCSEYMWSGGAYDPSPLKAGCMQAGGTPGAGCNRAGAIGGCRITSVMGMVTLVSTAWVYSGTVDSYKMICANNGGMFVSP